MRLFVAFDLPGEVREALGEAIARLKPLCRAARWTRAEGMHVTLKFIGHAIATGDTEKLDAARAALAAVKSSEPVKVSYRGVGFFPDARRPRVIWCGMEASENLARLAADIERGLTSLGIPREARTFVPHLTLARFKSPEGVNALVRSAAEWASRDFGSASETEFHLFESLLKPSGAEYRKIESYSFVRAGA
ncbi:MAG TPA: RNA 2',3'-cyclic phosphodiesterase [Candidatus Acidoferrales bacterium]|jgi:2'-5' RNA ligase|nr:RNA 2',3'-cyclic phosphodiesterase [Candidatus Acidoferrales bacterium]